MRNDTSLFKPEDYLPENIERRSSRVALLRCPLHRPVRRRILLGSLHQSPRGPPVVLEAFHKQARSRYRRTYFLRRSWKYKRQEGKKRKKSSRCQTKECSLRRDDVSLAAGSEARGRKSLLCRLLALGDATALGRRQVCVGISASAGSRAVFGEKVANQLSGLGCGAESAHLSEAPGAKTQAAIRPLMLARAGSSRSILRKTRRIKQLCC